MTGEDSGFKPGAFEESYFEYCALDKVFNKGLEKEGNKEGLLKILKNHWNIKDHGEKQLQMVIRKTAKKKFGFKNVYFKVKD